MGRILNFFLGSDKEQRTSSAGLLYCSAVGGTLLYLASLTGCAPAQVGSDDDDAVPALYAETEGHYAPEEAARCGERYLDDLTISVRENIPLLDGSLTGRDAVAYARFDLNAAPHGAIINVTARPPEYDSGLVSMSVNDCHFRWDYSRETGLSKATIDVVVRP